MLPRFATLSSFALLSVASVAAQDLLPVAYQTAGEWFIDVPAGEFGYSTQFAIVDKATGVIRGFEFYDFPGDPISQPSWQSGSERLPAPVDALSLSFGGYQTELIVPLPLENKVNTYSVYGYLSQAGIQAPGIGPERAFSFPAAPDQGQFEPVLLVQTGLNSPPNHVRHDLLLTAGSGEVFARSVQIGLEPFEYGFAFPGDVGSAFDQSNTLLALVAENSITLAVPALDGVTPLGLQPAPGDAQFFYGDFLNKSGKSQLLAYVSGDPQLYLYELLDEGTGPILSEPIGFELRNRVQMATRLWFNGEMLVAVHYANSQVIDLISLASEKIVARLTVADGESPVTGLVSINGDRLLVLTGKKDRSTNYELFGNNEDGLFSSLYSGPLPMDAFAAVTVNASPNIFFFDESPLATSAARLMAWYGSGSSVAWASDPKESFTSVQFRAWTYLGESGGLAPSFLSSTFVPDDSRAFLANQVNSSASISGLGIFGSQDRNLQTTWAPRPGAYDSLSLIEASFPENASLFLRLDDSQPWRRYEGAFFPEAETLTIQYFLETEDGTKGSIESVRYEFSLRAFNRDSNGDGIPDYVQAALGLDPYGTGDSDADGASDLDELVAETDPSDPSDFPATPVGVDRGLEETILLTSRNVRNVTWAPGSRGYVDRVIGPRLGSAAVADGLDHAELNNILIAQPEKLLALSTDLIHFCQRDTGTLATGLENLYLLPVGAKNNLDLGVSYTGGPISEAAGLWLAALEGSSLGGTATARQVDLTVGATAFALAMEYAFEKELKQRGYLAGDGQLTLFPNRSGDGRWSNLEGIAANVRLVNADPTFTAPALLADLNLEASFEQAELSFADFSEWQAFVEYVNEQFLLAELTPIVGANPVDLLRSVLRGGAMPEALMETLLIDAEVAISAAREAGDLRDSFVREQIEVFDLTLNSAADAGCLIARNVFAQVYSLFDEAGDRFVSSKTVDLLPGTAIRVFAIRRPAWNACSGIALEVRSLQVRELPGLLANDADRNLLDDNWELFWLGSSGNDPFANVDGSGYSLLQKFLGGHSADDPEDLPSEPIADLGAPDIAITLTAPNEVTLNWEWPGVYSDLIQFKLLQSDDLGNLSVITPTSVDYTRVGDRHEMVIMVPEADQRFFKLVLTL